MTETSNRIAWILRDQDPIPQPEAPQWEQAHQGLKLEMCLQPVVTDLQLTGISPGRQEARPPNPRIPQGVSLGATRRGEHMPRRKLCSRGDQK